MLELFRSKITASYPNKWQTRQAQLESEQITAATKNAMTFIKISAMAVAPAYVYRRLMRGIIIEPNNLYTKVLKGCINFPFFVALYQTQEVVLPLAPYLLDDVYQHIKFKLMFGMVHPNLEYINRSEPNEVVLIIRSTQDHNGALFLSTRFKRRLMSISSHYSIIMKEVTSLEDIEKVIDEVNNENIIKSLIICAHGNSQCISIAATPNSLNNINKTDLIKHNEIFNKIPTGSSIILESCNTNDNSKIKESNNAIEKNTFAKELAIIAYPRIICAAHETLNIETPESISFPSAENSTLSLFWHATPSKSDYLNNKEKLTPTISSAIKVSEKELREERELVHKEINQLEKFGFFFWLVNIGSKQTNRLSELKTYYKILNDKIDSIENEKTPKYMDNIPVKPRRQH